MAPRKLVRVCGSHRRREHCRRRRHVGSRPRVRQPHERADRRVVGLRKDYRDAVDVRLRELGHAAQAVGEPLQIARERPHEDSYGHVFGCRVPATTRVSRSQRVDVGAVGLEPPVVGCTQQCKLRRLACLGASQSLILVPQGPQVVGAAGDKERCTEGSPPRRARRLRLIMHQLGTHTLGLILIYAVPKKVLRSGLGGHYYCHGLVMWQCAAGGCKYNIIAAHTSCNE